MKLAFLSDAHCNSVGLAACLEHIAAFGVDDTFFLGDAVGYLSDPAVVLQTLRRSGAQCQQGNHEAMLLGELPLDAERDAHYRLSVQRERLDEAARNELAAWPLMRELRVSGVRMLLSHGSPAPSIVERTHEDTAWDPGGDCPYDVVLVGHTHRPFVRRYDEVQLVNVGSCGLPRDQGNLASFVIYDCVRRDAEIYRVPFDVERALNLHGDGISAEVRAVFDRREPFHGEVL